MMKGLLLGLSILTGLACPVQAQPTLQGFPPGTFQNRGALDGSASPSFSGPGNIVTGAVFYIGAEAYNGAYAAGLNKAFNVCLSGDSACGDLSFGADGKVVDSAIGGSLCSAVTCTIKTAYDQSGNSNDVTNATEATRPTISFSCQGGQACMVFASTAFLQKAGWHGAVNLAMPWTISAVYDDTGTSSVQGGGVLVTEDGAVSGLYSNDGSNNIAECYGGTSLTIAAANNSWHSVQAVGDTNPNADINVDGTAHTGNCGTRDLFAATLNIGLVQTSQYTGKIGRIGIWPAAFSAGNSTSMSTQDHTFWGF